MTQRTHIHIRARFCGEELALYGLTTQAEHSDHRVCTRQKIDQALFMNRDSPSLVLQAMPRFLSRDDRLWVCMKMRHRVLLHQGLSSDVEKSFDLAALESLYAGPTLLQAMKNYGLAIDEQLLFVQGVPGFRLGTESGIGLTRFITVLPVFQQPPTDDELVAAVAEAREEVSHVLTIDIHE